MWQVWQEGAHWLAVPVGELGPAGEVDVWAPVVHEDPLQPRRRILTSTERAHLKEACLRWLAQGFIEPSSAWVVCNPVFVEKANGRIRTCIDYRPVNRVHRIWEWNPLKIQDVRHYLVGSKWYTRLDLKDAFHRIRVEPDNRPWTAFQGHDGAYQFTRMPFGLSTAPPTFQRFIDWVLVKQREYTIRYVDDILIHATSLSQLRARQRQVLAALAKEHVEINQEKSEYERRSLKFVGLTVSSQGVGQGLGLPDTAPQPRLKKEWESAMGFANCYRDFVPGFADLAAGLYPGKNQLGEPDRLRKWNLLWEAMGHHTGLSHWRDNAPAWLFTDASGQATGAVLLQKQGVIGIHSKGLSESQKRYSTTDREHLALLRGVEHFRVFLQRDMDTTAMTDHTALLNRDDDRLSFRQSRWKRRIMEVTERIKYVPGLENPADFWSRQGAWKGGGN